MDFRKGGQTIRRLRKTHGLTQEQLAELTETAPNSISRIERGLLTPSLPTLIKICNVLETTADTILAAYITADTDLRWSDLAQRMEGIDLEKQSKIESILNCLIETL